MRKNVNTNSTMINWRLWAIPNKNVRNKHELATLLPAHRSLSMRLLLTHMTLRLQNGPLVSYFFFGTWRSQPSFSNLMYSTATAIALES
jgi:hypothetical protein